MFDLLECAGKGECEEGENVRKAKHENSIRTRRRYQCVEHDRKVRFSIYELFSSKKKLTYTQKGVV